MIAFNEMPMPKLFRIEQCIASETIENPEPILSGELEKFRKKIGTGTKIGIAAGSRGIYHYSWMIKTVVTFVKECGAQPYIIPAMGSHGGATAEGQKEVLSGYGITEATMGAPILSSMETEIIDWIDGTIPVHFDRHASQMDGIIMINRVKPHTDFHGKFESGLMKQMAVGLGKQKGASTIHRRGIEGLQKVMPECARCILKKMPIIGGVAILENQQDKTTAIIALAADEIEREEPHLLERAKKLLPSLPIDRADVLVLQEMGKNISGTGIDPNVVGRYLIRGVEDRKPEIYRIVCLDLTDESHHNAIGVGIADIITQKMYDKIDLEPTYINTITSGFLERGFMPLVAKNDEEAIKIALNCCNRFVTAENAKIIFAKNTLNLNELVVSEALLKTIDPDYIRVIEEVDIQWRNGVLKSLF